MAEIKSTRDLIMERTKGLTMTDEEKRALHLRDLRGKVKGWVQKCIDGVLDYAHLQETVQQEKTKEPELLAILSQELLERIDPDGENGLLFQIMEGILGRNVTPLRELIGGYQNELAENTLKKTLQVKRDLAQRNISGSAVEPNLDRDPRWKKDRDRLKAFYVQRIRQLAAL